MKKNLLTKLVAGIVTTGLSVGALTGCGTTGSETAAAGNDAGSTESKIYRTLDEIKASGTVNIGVFSDKNPFGYVDENGEYQGYDVYFAERIGQPKDLLIFSPSMLTNAL